MLLVNRMHKHRMAIAKANEQLTIAAAAVKKDKAEPALLAFQAAVQQFDYCLGANNSRLDTVQIEPGSLESLRKSELYGDATTDPPWQLPEEFHRAMDLSVAAAKEASNDRGDAVRQARRCIEMALDATINAFIYKKDGTMKKKIKLTVELNLPAEADSDSSRSTTRGSSGRGTPYTPSLPSTRSARNVLNAMSTIGGDVVKENSRKLKKTKSTDQILLEQKSGKVLLSSPRQKQAISARDSNLTRRSRGPHVFYKLKRYKVGHISYTTLRGDIAPKQALREALKDAVPGPEAKGRASMWKPSWQTAKVGAGSNCWAVANCWASGVHHVPLVVLLISMVAFYSHTLP
eukprot:SAG31_NODE_48_length_30945_cov_16.254263_30_plen_347_part_00